MATLSLKTKDAAKLEQLKAKLESPPVAPIKVEPPIKAAPNLPDYLLGSVKEAVTWIIETWPGAFTSPRVPLAIGVGEIIIAARPDHISGAAVNRALMFLMRADEYVDACATDHAMRFDLDGEPTERVSEQDRHSASLNLHYRAMKAANKLAKAGGK